MRHRPPTRHPVLALLAAAALLVAPPLAADAVAEGRTLGGLDPNAPLEPPSEATERRPQLRTPPDSTDEDEGRGSGLGPRRDAVPPLDPRSGPRRPEVLPVTPGGSAVHYVPPHPGGVLREFEPPGGPYGAGHRGVDLDAIPGQDIVAAGAGVVTFAGDVAGTRWVTILHPDGVLTSYGPLAGLSVQRGTTVRTGARLGRLSAAGHGTDGADPGLHWSARRDGDYVDPLTLLGGGIPRPTLVGPGGWEGTHPVVEGWDRWGGEVSRFGTRLEDSPVAEEPGYAVPPNWHHLVVLPGLNSDGVAPFDASLLGYGDDDTTLFSYTGCTPTPTGCEPRSYEAIDTHHGLERAAHDLMDLLRELQRAQPNRPVDLVGHSQGGLVASYFLQHLHDPTDPELPPIANLVTYGTPYGGSPIADLGDSLSQSLLGHLVDGPAAIAGHVTDSSLPDQIRTTSPSMRDMQRTRAERHLGWTDSPPIPMPPAGTRSLHLAGKEDKYVRKNDAAPDDGEYSILPGGHTEVAATEAAHQQAHDFLAGREVERVDSWAFGATGNLLGGLMEGGAVVVDMSNALVNEILLGKVPGANPGPAGLGYRRLADQDTQGRSIER